MASTAPKWLSPDLQGGRVQLRMNDGNIIEGVVVDVSLKSYKVTLDQVTVEENGVQQSLVGQLHFYAQEISSCVVLEGPARRRYILHRDEDGPRLLRVRPLPAHLEKLNSAHNNRELICHRQETDTSEVIKKGIIKLIGTPDDLPNLRRPIATDFEVIDEVNDQLSEAIAAIRKEQTISIAYEGVKVGRHGHLSVLAVVASSKVYVFDVQKMKKDLFDHGLKEIFESDGIEKIIHGCQNLSDCLHHHYQVGLNNVFDTMVADVMIYFNKGLEAGDFQFPKYVRGVQSCLKTFLNMSYDQLKYTRSRQGSKEDQACTWEQRPLSLRQIDALVKDVVYLGELAHVCLKKMLQKFRMGVEFFLGLYRDCSEEELQCLPPDHILPTGFRDALMLSAMHAAPYRTWRSYNEGCYRAHGHLARRDNNRNHHHYRDSLRHGHGFSSMNNDRVHSRQPRDSYHQEECNQKQNDHYNVKEGKRMEDSLLYIAMQLQTNETSTELSDPAMDTARKSNVGESEKLNTCSEPTESMQEEPATSALQDHCPVSDENNEDSKAERDATDESHLQGEPATLTLQDHCPEDSKADRDATDEPHLQKEPATSALQDHCPVADGNKEDSKADRDATDEPHPDTSSCNFERDVRFPAPRCRSMSNGMDAFRQMLSQHCSGSRPLCDIPSGNHDSGHQVEVLTAEHSSDNNVLALPETLVEHCNGSARRFDTMQHKSLVQVSSQSSSPPSCRTPAGKEHRSPQVQRANRPVNENKKGTSFRPVDMIVAKYPG
ncbi:hypothetical protein MRX96_038082 [Rhipicephalus microplus]